MIDLTKLLDEDIYQSYLNELKGREFLLACKNYPKHHLKNNSMSGELLIKVRRFLSSSLKLDKNFSRIDEMDLKSKVPSIDGALTIFEFTFKNIPKIEVGPAALEKLKELNLEDYNLSSFCKEYINNYSFYHGKLDPAHIQDIIQKAKMQEKKNAVTMDRFLEFLEEYNLYYDYETKEFTYSLK